MRVVLVGKRFEFVRVTAGGIGPVPLRFIEVEETLRSSTSEKASIRRRRAVSEECQAAFGYTT